MVGIDPSVISHCLNTDPKFTSVRQKRRPLNRKRYVVLQEEVERMLKNNFIRNMYYPKCIANTKLVKKPNGKWKACIDFTDLNTARPKDCFPLPRVNQSVNAISGHQLLSFMDAYFVYNQLLMFKFDEEHTSFTINIGTCRCNVISFDLKNAGATYQRLVNQMFTKHIG